VYNQEDRYKQKDEEESDELEQKGNEARKRIVNSQRMGFLSIPMRSKQRIFYEVDTLLDYLERTLLVFL